MKIPNIRHLRAFCAVCRYKSINQASKVMYLSQPAITQAIAKLETELNVSLFDRNSEGMSTTEAGFLFLKRVEIALKYIEMGTLEAIRVDSKKKVAHNHLHGHQFTAVQLRSLIAVAEARNFSLAARNINTSQPSVYRAARELEKQLGIELFIKSKEGIELSRAALPFVRNIKLAFSELKQGVMEIESWLGRDSGSIVIGSMPLARTDLLPKTINQFSQMFPYVKIRIIDGRYPTLLHGLRHGEIDFLVGALRSPIPIDDISQLTMFQDMLAVVCRTGHPLAKKKKLNLNDLASYPWVVPSEGTPTRDYFNSMFDDIKLQKPNQLVESSSLILIRSLLHGSDRVALLSKHQIYFEEQLKLLKSLPIELPNAKRAIGLTLRKVWRPTTTQQKFLDLLKNMSNSYE